MKKWLTNKNCWVKSPHPCTHALMDRGSIYIDDSRIETFNNIYCESIRQNEKLCFVEQRTRPTFYFFIDVDFMDEKEMTQDVLEYLCTLCQSAINRKDTITVCATEPREKDNLIKTGLHIHWNCIVHENDISKIIDNIVGALLVKFPQFAWKKFIDTSVYNGGGLRMKWSHKYQNKQFLPPYLPVMEFTHKESIPRYIPPGITPWLLNRTSIRDAAVEVKTFEKKLEGGFTPSQTANQVEPAEGFEEWIRLNLEGQGNTKVMCIYSHPTHAFVKTNSKYCENLGRHHNSNHVYFHLDLKTNKLRQHCFCTCDTLKGRKNGLCSGFKGKTHVVPFNLISHLKTELVLFKKDYNTTLMNNFYKKTSKTK